jgi:hypothetical protein
MMNTTAGTWEIDSHRLPSEKLTDRIHLGQNEAVTFHWADFSEACGLWQSRIDREPHLRADYEQRVREIEKLRRLAVWVRHGKKVTQTNLYELYDGFIREKTWHGQDLLPHAQREVSFVSPSGPFKHMPVTECFHRSTYQDFVFVLLLQNKLPRRTFRLRIQSRLLTEYGAGLREAVLVSLEQITSQGLLVKTSSETFFASMNPHHRVRFLFSSHSLRSAVAAASFEGGIAAWSANPFYTHDKSESFEIDCSQMRVSESKAFNQALGPESYLFVGFEQIALSNPALAQDLKAFITRGEASVRRIIGASLAA